MNGDIPLHDLQALLAVQIWRKWKVRERLSQTERIETDLQRY